jgi:predicted RNA-binding Zn-ribbon protein involved in translation (DUF1610 family)
LDSFLHNMSYSRKPIHPSSVIPPQSDLRSHSSLTYSSPVSSSGTQERGPLVGLGITGCDIEHAFDQLRVLNVPTMQSQLMPGTPTFELPYEEYVNGPCYPTIYHQLPNASQDSVNFYSPTSVSASPSYNSAMEIGPNQDAFPGMSDLWMHTPCSGPTTPSEVVSATGGNGTRGPWDQAMFADVSNSLTIPLLPFNHLPYAGTTGEETGYVRPSRQNVNVEAVGAQSKIAPSTTTEQPVLKTRKRSRGSSDKLVSASGLECPMCGIKFTRRSNCKEHQKMHNPNWKHNYPCEECSKSFGRSADLKRHMNTVS